MSEMCYLFKHCLKDNKRNVDEKTVGLFYFSGEGAQDSDESKNYLIPIEANIRNSYDLKHQSVAVEEIVETMEQTGAMNIVIIDACRNNL